MKLVFFVRLLVDFKFIKRNWRKDKIPEFCKRPLANSFILQTVVDCFEKKKSPFFHFGERMNLKKIPYEDFYAYIESRLPDMPASQKASITEEILKFTDVHPYYTQQLSAAVYNAIEYGKIKENPVAYAIKKQVEEHSLDYERLWANMNRTDRKVMIALANRSNPMADRSVASSTLFSSIKRLLKQGYVIKTTGYELEDPFFGEWILGN